ncbi:MAG: hypothetical protein WCY05_01115 [Candidatus Omnitrophota bacterium]
MKKTIVLMLLLGIIFTGYAQAQEWYKLESAETYVTDFLLAAGQTKEITIDSAEPIIVGFKTDLTYAPNSHELYKELMSKYKFKVIRISDKNGSAVSSISGGAGQFKPIDNKVVMEISNLIDRDFKIVIYKKTVDF